jgi:heme-binding NEAT domain protein
MIFKTYGLRKAMNIVEIVCIPNVSENISIVSPNNIADTRSIHFGVSKGSKRINKTYI